MSAPDYREYAPRASLADYVRCVWTFRAPTDNAPQPIAPDGCCELIIHRAVPYLERGDGGDVAQAPILFAGQLTAPLTLVAARDVDVIGVRFQPWAARAFLGRVADSATDKRIDLENAHGAEATETLNAVRRAPSIEEGVSLAQDYVAPRVADRRLDADVRAAVLAMMAGDALPAPNGVSERQWQRRFKAEVGVSPRQLQSVLRFRRVFDEIEKPGPVGWVEAALAAGYFDQPQMARDFRRFLGVSSRQWAGQKLGLAKAMAAPETYKKSGPA
ncbi:MAG: hypothetical protein DCF16_09105 [Alphaproteobacteria bacterium]|nr:MAG: hypothetical protein DCF16_09105 [Alphaproteobacteria bacterium]